LLAGGIGLGLSQRSVPLIVAVVIVTLSLWVLEAIWKSFQYCLTDRIEMLERWFRGEGPEEIRPFQIFTTWGEVYRRHYGKPSSIIPLLRQPFVFLPYLPIALFGIVALFLVSFGGAQETLDLRRL
jgi:hypothetical protein